MNLHGSNNASIKLYDSYHQTAAATFLRWCRFCSVCFPAVPDVQMHACDTASLCIFQFEFFI